MVVPRPHNKQDSMEAVRVLSMAWIDEEHCVRGIRCHDRYCKEWDEKHGTYKSQPVHNWASHGSDAAQTGACGHRSRLCPAAKRKVLPQVETAISLDCVEERHGH